MTTRKEFMTQLVQECGLVMDEDIWKMKRGGKTIELITRAGIEKIQWRHDISVTYTPIVVGQEFCVMKAVATMGELQIETFASAWHGDGGNCQSNYVPEMAEKRSKGRAVLQVVGAYKFNVFSEDESDDFKRENKDER